MNNEWKTSGTAPGRNGRIMYRWCCLVIACAIVTSSTLSCSDDPGAVGSTLSSNAPGAGAAQLASCESASGISRIVYVDDDAPPAGDGSSWATAYAHLQDALASATAGDQIRVARGVYRPDQSDAENAVPGDRRASFELMNDVAIHGGFAGLGALNPNACDVVRNETILTGDLNGDDAPLACTQDSSDCDSLGGACVDGECLINDNNSENSYHVVTSGGNNATAILFAFTITGGNANDESFPRNHGGGMANSNSSPTVIQCTFRGNMDDENSGGMMNISSSPTVTSCTFQDNTVGMQNFSASSPTVTDCVFQQNMGGGVFNTANSSPAFSKCVFRRNFGFGMRSGNLTLSDTSVTECMFSENIGGGMFSINSDVTFTNCEFSGNTMGPGLRDGGGGRLTLINCKFVGNISDGSGGGMTGVSDTTTLTNCSFIGNSAASWGGGMYSAFGSPTLKNCKFVGNSAGERGGGISNLSSSPTLINCIFTGNTAGIWGGGMHNESNSSPTVTNCTFSANSAKSSGGGILNRSTSNPIVTNSIFWNNSDEDGMAQSSQIHDLGDSAAIVNYSDVQGGWAGAGGTGNIADDPLFADALGPDKTLGTDDDDLRLRVGSPCIDAGNNSALPPDVTTDLLDNPRFLDDRDTSDSGIGSAPIVDMGALEAEA